MSNEMQVLSDQVTATVSALNAGASSLSDLKAKLDAALASGDAAQAAILSSQLKSATDAFSSVVASMTPAPVV